MTSDMDVVMTENRKKNKIHMNQRTYDVYQWIDSCENFYW